ncbi:uncharacterized protein LOC131294707 [Anopheles ziemanni]|uniref:uncharacterized protein LOC131265295 n=1 Tax=Anopheles coustani TaxID=139045 RepID=UPI0026599E02|nr:uncharacterized protein LOC131265295 [Anopheles coustani]XP_058178734.1 uncharacterized protein LOC131294707 [Anopheles ziemanni]
METCRRVSLLYTVFLFSPKTYPYVCLLLTEDKCSPFEVLKPAEPCCEPTCVDDCSHAICRRAPNAGSVPSCVCRQGYVRHKGSCIRKEACPTPSVSYGSYDSYRPVPLTKTVLPMQKKCSQNEELAYCRPYCEATCEQDCKGVPPPKTCIPDPSCVCKDGFVRHNGRCIQKCDCPRRNPLLRRPLSGEYIDFEVVSMEGMKSDEDFDYPLPEPRVGTNERAFSRFESKKPAMVPVYLRTVSSDPKSTGSCGCKGHTTEKPELFPPLCACRGGKSPTPAPTYAPKLDENASFESTEEDSDIVPYVPPLPSTNSYAPRLSTPLFPPSTQPAPGHYAHRNPLPMPPVHRVDLNEPLDHFYGSGQATSAQQNSAAQEEPDRKPMTIWPPVCFSCKRCGLNRNQR